MPNGYTEETFEERYNNLNPEQKRAVDTIDGPVMVVAGPGTGKTEILTLRIANILRLTDTAPENILALTFTDAAAANMRRRLSRLIGARAYRVRIETFHSFCNSIIKDFPEYFEGIVGAAAITEVESIAMLEEIMRRVPLSLLRPWGEPLHYIKSIHKKIEELKREGVSPERFSELVTQEEKVFASRTDLYHEKGAHKGKMKSEHQRAAKTIEKNKELALVYAEYQSMSAERRLYDYSDMIMEVLRALPANPELKLQLQETYQYILVDEHQDTNNAQNKIIEQLADFHQNPNIFVVGDEKQAIFRFQGASAQNFLYFKNLYPSAALVELSRNYRSGQHILDAAHSLLSGVELSAGNDQKSFIAVAEFTSKTREIRFVAEEVKRLIDGGAPAEEIAVMYRANREAFAVAEALERLGIKYTIESDEDLLSEKFVRKLLIVLNAVEHYGSDVDLVPVLHIDEFGIDPLDAYRLIARSSQERRSLYDLINDSDKAEAAALAKKLKSWASRAPAEHVSEFIEQVLRESGILQGMIESRDASAFLGIERLFEEAKRISENRPGALLRDLMEYIRIVRERGIFVKRPKHSSRPGFVRLMTVHKSKGLEFDHVFITNATEKSFGEKGSREELPLLQKVYVLQESRDKSQEIREEDTVLNDERRLFYVALTRARQSIFISYATFDENGKEILPSPFILEIRDDRKMTVDTADFEKWLEHDPSLLLVERVKTGVHEVDRDFVNELFRSYPMSVTALNNYLDCPWKYFYRNLLRIPSVPERHQLYGTAMHAAIEDLWSSMKERGPDRQYLLDSYKRELGLLGILTEREFAEALERGTKALSGWFDWAKPDLHHPVMTEFSIPCVTLVQDDKHVDLSGKLDKVVFMTDTKVNVTDYKTGKQKSRNAIMGKTKEGNGDIYRQLVFYKLLLELHDGMRMQEGCIEFLEPNESGNYSREAFEISDEEVSELKQLIVKTADEITTLAFWNKTCDDKDCEYCSYRKLLKQ